MYAPNSDHKTMFHWEQKRKTNINKNRNSSVCVCACVCACEKYCSARSNLRNLIYCDCVTTFTLNCLLLFLRRWKTKRNNKRTTTTTVTAALIVHIQFIRFWFCFFVSLALFVVAADRNQIRIDRVSIKIVFFLLSSWSTFACTSYSCTMRKVRSIVGVTLRAHTWQ